jgi:hypothetical protein
VNNSAKAYIAAVMLTGAAVIAFAVTHWRSDNVARFAVFLVMFIAAAMLKCKVPGVAASYSPVFFFSLLASASLSFSEVVIGSALAGMVQCIFLARQRTSVAQVCFNGANMLLSTAAAYVFIERQVAGLTAQPLMIGLILGASAFYMVNTGLVATVITLVEGGSLAEIWKHWCVSSLACYLAGAVIACGTISAAAPVTTVVAFILLATACFRMGQQPAAQ